MKDQWLLCSIQEMLLQTTGPSGSSRLFCEPCSGDLALCSGITPGGVQGTLVWCWGANLANFFFTVPLLRSPHWFFLDKPEITINPEKHHDGTEHGVRVSLWAVSAQSGASWKSTHDQVHGAQSQGRFCPEVMRKSRPLARPSRPQRQGLHLWSLQRSAPFLLCPGLARSGPSLLLLLPLPALT